MKSSITIPKGLLEIDKSIIKAVEKGINDCTDDLLRVASLRTPVDSTTLEKSGTSDVSSNANNITGEVSFQAINKGYNYAIKMDKGNYKLGEKSLKKSSKGVRSKFSKMPLKVGSGYLSDTAEKCQEGYTDHVNYQIYEAIAKDGFKVLKKD